MTSGARRLGLQRGEFLVRLDRLVVLPRPLLREPEQLQNPGVVGARGGGTLQDGKRTLGVTVAQLPDGKRESSL